MLIGKPPEFFVDIFKNGEKREFETKRRKFWLFWKDENYVSAIRVSGKKINIERIKRRLEEYRRRKYRFIIDDNYVGEKDINFLDDFKEDNYYFFALDDIVYIGKEKPFLVYDCGKVPYEFFRNNCWILSIKKKFVFRIFSGEKRYELRKDVPKELRENDFVFIYAVGEGMVGYFRVGEVRKLKVEKIWELYKKDIGISRNDFFRYYKSHSYGYVIEIKEFRKFKDVFGFREMMEKFPDIKPSQTFVPVVHKPSFIEYVLRVGL